MAGSRDGGTKTLVGSVLMLGKSSRRVWSNSSAIDERGEGKGKERKGSNSISVFSYLLTWIITLLYIDGMILPDKNLLCACLKGLVTVHIYNYSWNGTYSF